MHIVGQTHVHFTYVPILGKNHPPPVCSGASHQAIHKHDLAKMDVEYRRMMRMVAGPLADTNGASPWHNILQWMEQQSRDAFGLRWTETFACDMHASSLCPPNAGPGRFWNGIVEGHENAGDQLTLRKQC